MNVYCYHHDAKHAAAGYESELLSRWRATWSKRGFNPVMLTEVDARRHPRFDEIDSVVSKLPTVNVPFFERACWLRWLAYDLSTPGLFTDYDVMNYSLTPDALPSGEGLLPLEEPVSPGLFRSTVEGTTRFIDAIGSAECPIIGWKGGWHACDLLLMQALWPATFRPLSSVYLNVMEGRSLLRPCVHFNNNGLLGRQLNTCAVIDAFTTVMEKCIR